MSSYVYKIAKEKNLPVIDAAEPALIEVAPADIRKATATNSKCCAFARAAQKEPGVLAAYFFRATAFIEYADRIMRYVLPSNAKREIVSFDRAGIMAPGAYYLYPVPLSQTKEELRRYTKETASPRKKAQRKALKRAARPGKPAEQRISVVRAASGAPLISGLAVPRTRTAPKYVRDQSDPDAKQKSKR